MRRILIIEPTVFIWTNKKECLFYNYINNKYLYYKDIDIIDIANSLSNNNYIIEINNELFKTKKKFFNDIMVNIIGYIDSINNKQKKPINLAPISSVQNSYELSKSDFHLTIGSNIYKHLKEVSIYINTHQINKTNHNLHKQFLFPIYSNDKVLELLPQQIIVFLNKINKSPVKNINIIGHNIFNYSGFNEIIKHLKSINIIKNFFVILDDLDDKCKNIVKLKDNNNKIIITVFEDYKKEKIECLINIAEKNDIPIHFRFAVSKESQLNNFSQLIDELTIDNYNFIPYITNNIDFFLKNVYLSFEEVLKTNNNLIEIHEKEYINPLSYGKLLLLPDNLIYANIHNKNVSDNNKNASIKEAIYKAIISNSDWRLTRNKVDSCKDCVAKFLCTPISNYEFYTKQYKTCIKL